MKKGIIFFVSFAVALVVFGAYTPVSVEDANFTSTLTTSGKVINTSTATSVTNGATLTPTAAIHVLNGIGGADDTTNTITIANATDGQLLTLIVNSASTNLITIADSGNCALSSAWVGDNNDAITLRGVSTNWVEVSVSDN